MTSHAPGPPQAFPGAPVPLGNLPTSIEIEEIHTGQLTFEDLDSMPRSAPKEAPQNPL